MLKSANGPFDAATAAQVTKYLQDHITLNVGSAYAKRLAAAYLKATGKHLANPGAHMTPIYGYILGHSPNVDPDILGQLKPEDAKDLTGWGTMKSNVTPGMLLDGVDYINAKGGYIPLDQGPGFTTKSKTLTAVPLNGTQLVLNKR